MSAISEGNFGGAAGAMNLWAVFLTGLTVGGLSCMAVQGGFLASVISTRSGVGGSRLSALWATATFLLAKLVVYTILGFLLGFVGESLSLPIFAILSIQLVAGLYIVGIALNLLNVHSIFRRLIIQPPAFLRRAVRDQSKSDNLFAPAFLGFMTIFVPCGTTLSMQALAISTTSGVSGAGVMAAFTLGTFPLFLGLGVLTGGFSKLSRKIAVVPAAILVYLGLSSVNGALVLAGSPVTFGSIGGVARDLVAIAIDPTGADFGGQVKAAKASRVEIVDGVQVASIGVYASRYDPEYLEVQSGMPVRLDVTPRGGLGCTSVFIIPKLGISRPLQSSGTTSIAFTPEEPGALSWTCSMGMYSGTIKVL